ncbi:MAG: ATP synthase F1 subunit epsilon [Planctomycetota bacterium]|nr:MAG: ATP synthase F1 subunit epsilon [Planctomycetota bacterium]
MARTFRLEVVTPEGSALRCDAQSLQAPGHLGYLGVLPGHAPMLCLLRPGVLSVRAAGEATERIFAVRGGFLEAQPEAVTVLADEVRDAQALDVVELERRIAELPPLPESYPGETIEARARMREQARTERTTQLEWLEAQLEAVHRLHKRG